jgi:multidrug efflux pump subunit AcrA (membrane-fusion protein)
LAGFAWSLAQRPPGVDGETVWSGVVTKGEFAHEITAAGKLISPDIRSVTNRSAGVVERVFFLAGESVKPHDIVVELSSPQLLEELNDAQSQLASAEAEELLRQIEAEDQLFNLQAAAADAEAAFTTAQIEAEAEKLLHAAEASSDIELQRKQSSAEQQGRRYEAARAQLERYPETRAARDESAQAKLDQQRRKVERLQEKVSDLQVRAGIGGDILEISVEEGERVAEGADIARVVDQSELIARVQVSERDAAMVQPGQPVRLEMGRELVKGIVTRIEPTVQDRLVTLDVELVDPPKNRLRANTSVTARIEIDRVPETLVLDRPAGLRDDQQTIDLFRLDAKGQEAQRVNVEVGRISARQVEIVRGLEPGDRIVLADMTEWLDEPVVRIR